MNREQMIYRLADELESEYNRLKAVDKNFFGEKPNTRGYKTAIQVLRKHNTSSYNSEDFKIMSEKNNDIMSAVGYLLLGQDDTILYDYGIL